MPPVDTPAQTRDEQARDEQTREEQAGPSPEALDAAAARGRRGGRSVPSRLEALLPHVGEPVQHVGGELDATVEEWGCAGPETVRWALMHPDADEVGVPDQGVMILSEVLDERADALAERTHAVRPDLEAHLDPGLDEDWLWEDWQEALSGVQVEDRWTPCSDCGVCPTTDTSIQVGPSGRPVLPLGVARGPAGVGVLEDAGAPAAGGTP